MNDLYVDRYLCPKNRLQNLNTFSFLIGEMKYIPPNVVYTMDVYKKFNDIKSLMYEVETALEEVYDADDLQVLSIELSEFNYYHNTNK